MGRTLRMLTATGRRLARSERGVAVPMVLIIIVVGLGLAGAAVIASIYAQHGSTRDQSSTAALAAADAGAQVAMFRQDRILTTTTLPCVIAGVTGNLLPGIAASDGWCPAETAPDGSWTYRVKPWSLSQDGLTRQIEIVSVGTVNGVSRRLDISASAKSGVAVYNGKGAIGNDRVTISGSSHVGTTTTGTNVGTNGNVYLQSSATLCGNAYHGTSGSLVQSGSSTQCAGYGSYSNQIVLPPVDPGTSWTTNDDSRICGADPVAPAGQCSNGPSDTSKGVSFNSSTRILNMKSSSTLTLGGSTYSLCGLNMSGSSKIIVASTAKVTLYFDSPEKCGLTGNPVSEISMGGNPRLTTTSQDPSALKILIVGSSTIPTSVSMTGNPSTDTTDYNTFTMYAPLTDVNLGGNPTYLGAVAGKTLNVNGSAILIQDARATGSTIPIAINYQRDRYVECAGATATVPSPPNTSC